MNTQSQPTAAAETVAGVKARQTRAQKIAAGIPKPFLGEGNRKKRTADARKEERKSQYYARLNNLPSSPRKMRLVADVIRGLDVQRALHILSLSPRHASVPMFKLLRAAIDSFEAKSGQRADAVALYVKTVMVDGGPMLKRLRPAPQGRGHRIRKRSNHVTIALDVRTPEQQAKLRQRRVHVSPNQPQA